MSRIEDFISSLSEETKAELVVFHFNLFMKHMGKNINDSNEIDLSKIPTVKPSSKSKAARILVQEFGKTKSSNELSKIAKQRWNLDVKYYDIANARYYLKQISGIKQNIGNDKV